MMRDAAATQAGGYPELLFYDEYIFHAGGAIQKKCEVSKKGQVSRLYVNRKEYHGEKAEH